MTGSVVLGVFLAGGWLLATVGLLLLAYYPLAFAYLWWERKVLRRAADAGYAPSVSVLVPAYNEATTIEASLRSMLASDYPDFEVIVINDGSTDATASVLERLPADARVRVLHKRNGGKASALNHGLEHARGEVVLFTDADTFFAPETISRGVAYLADPKVGAAGGDDTPLHPRGWLQRMLVVTSHIGTGFVRRALSMAGVLPIIPGNLGLIRTALLREIGGFREIWGEDLELTIRLHRHGARVVYAAGARVRAECPNNLRDLWRQRIRWVRSYVKVLALHRDLPFRPRFGAFAYYLPFNAACFIVFPLVQILVILLLPAAMLGGVAPDGWLEWGAYLGLGSLLAAAVTAILLDRSPRDLMFLPYLIALVPMSLFYNAVVLWSLWSELRAHREDWSKLGRRDPAAAAQTDPLPGRRALIAGGVSAVAVGALAMRHPSTGAAPEHPVPAGRKGLQLAVAIHFADWRDPRDAVRALLAEPDSAVVDRVAVSAGRVDWAYFSSRHSRAWGSLESTLRSGALFDETVATLQRRGQQTTAVLDVFAPRYLERYPDEAAVDVNGGRSRDIVCATLLEGGRYGRLLLDAFDGLCGNTACDSISVTELFYDGHCFDERCKHRFRLETGASDWPRRTDGRIDLRDGKLSAWRSSQVARVVSRLGTIAGRHGKKFLFDVRLSRDDLTRHSSENGQDYRQILAHADQMVVWDYFALESLAPQASAPVARYLSDTFGANRYWHSIGLWARGGKTLAAAPFLESLDAAYAGGARSFWITPGQRLSPAHWAALARFRSHTGDST